MKLILKSLAVFALAISLTNCGEKKETDAVIAAAQNQLTILKKNDGYSFRSRSKQKHGGYQRS